MKLIKLSGREAAVLRAVENLGSTGAEIHERTQIATADLADVLSALCDAGYLEAYRGEQQLAVLDSIKAAEVLTTRFEINPSYALELKKALARR